MPRECVVRRRAMPALGSVAALVLVLKASTAVAACALPNGTSPGVCTYSAAGTGLAITDTNATGTPMTIEGKATGANGRGLVGAATGKNGQGVFG